MALIHPEIVWERMYAPYDLDVYQAVLKEIRPQDVILDIGAGDLRLARQMARIAQKVYAIEIIPELLSHAQEQEPIPENLLPVCGDACTWDFPCDITVGVLLMRHCLHFRQYAEKLRASGTRKLITNARWRLDVEIIDLHSPRRIPYPELEMGWYACWCGSTGFKTGPAESLTAELANTIFEVLHCPVCSNWAQV